MRSSLWILGLSLFVIGCLDTHERDNPLDQKGEAWDESIMPNPASLMLSEGESDTLLYDCSVPDYGQIAQYILEYSDYDDGTVFRDSSKNGKFSIFVGKEDINLNCIVEDETGARLRSPDWGTIHRNVAPVIDSSPRFDSWTELDWHTGEGKGIISVSVLDYDGFSHNDYAVRIDLDGVVGNWDTLWVSGSRSILNVKASLTYNSAPHYRIVVRDYLKDSAVVEGVLSLDTIAPCLNLGPTSFTDIRDGRVYSCAWIGGKSWMTENVDFGVVVPAVKAQSDNLQLERYCPGDSAKGCANSGGYYQWAEAVGESYSCNRVGDCAPDVHSPQGVCPPGWHIPSKDEWGDLINLDKENPFFENLFHGYVDLDGIFQDREETAYFWTTTTEATSSTLDHSISLRLSKEEAGINWLGFRMEERRRGLSVRCVLD